MSDTYNITLFNTDTVKYNDGTEKNVTKIVLNGQTVWVTKPANVTAKFTTKLRHTGKYSRSARTGRVSSSIIYPFGSYNGPDWAAGSGMAGYTGQSLATAYRFPTPVITNRGMGYVVGQTYGVTLPATYGNYKILSGYNATANSRGYTRRKWKFTVTGVTTPLNVVSTTNGHYGSIKSYDLVPMKTSSPYYMAAETYYLRTSGGAVLGRGNDISLTNCSADAP